VPVPASRPAWPGWLTSLLGLALLVTSVGMAGVQAQRGAASNQAGLFAALGVLGALLLVAGLAWFAVRAIERKRGLPEYRYRGPSVLLLLILVLAVGNCVTLLGGVAALAAGVPLRTLAGPVGLAVLVAVTPITMLLVSALFVLAPRALAGLRLTDGPRTFPNLARGLALALPTWVAAGVVGLVVTILLERLFGIEPPDPQRIAEILVQIPLPVALLLAAGLAPIAEELFFRGIIFNAWDREYGRRRAIAGSATLFAAIHMLDGRWAALPSLFVVGLILAIVYARFESLPMTIGVHAAFNTIGVIALFAAVR
jgi:membrane protease YdiL (CAAX protease family)